MSSKVCPVCTEFLRPNHSHGIEIDYCPRCKGVWLDHGELEKVIQAAKPYTSSGWTDSSHTQPQHGYGSPPPAPPQYGGGYNQGGYNQGGYNQGYGHQSHGHYDHKKKKKDSFLEELFDIF